MNKSFIVIGLLAGVLAVSSATADPTDHKINQDTNQLKKDYQTKVHKDLKEIGAKIDHLKRDVEKDGKTAGNDVGREVKKLEVQKAGVDRKLVVLEKSTGDAWKDMRQGVDDALADLKRSVDEATHQFAKK